MRAVRSSRPDGFTLVELLLVISMVGILMALLVPAVFKIRTLADRLHCANNLRQIGVAAHQFYHAHSHLPEAVTMPYAEPGDAPGITDASGIPPYIMLPTDSAARKDSNPNSPFGPNWAVYLLPYLDEQGLYARARVGDYLQGYQTNDAARRDYWRTVLANQSLAIYRCRADRGADVPFAGYSSDQRPWARGNYAANAGPGWWQTSYQGGSYTEAYGTAAPVMGINFGATYEQIPDGLATTVMFNEVRVGVNARDPRGVWAMGYPGASVTAANAIGDCTVPNDSSPGSDDVEGCPQFYYPDMGPRDHIGCSTGWLNLGWPSWQAQARSRHPDGVNACFVDGSVRFVSNYVSQQVWFYMLSSRDGQQYLEDE